MPRMTPFSRLAPTRHQMLCNFPAPSTLGHFSAVLLSFAKYILTTLYVCSRFSLCTAISPSRPSQVNTFKEFTRQTGGRRPDPHTLPASPLQSQALTTHPCSPCLFPHSGSGLLSISFFSLIVQKTICLQGNPLSKYKPMESSDPFFERHRVLAIKPGPQRAWGSPCV